MDLMAAQALLLSPHAPDRPVFRYHGSKWRIAPWLISHIPGHVCYVEPFAGSASIILRKARSAHEVLNDRDEDVINFFAVLRDDHARGHLIQQLELTPFARSEYYAAYQPCSEPVERARRFFIRAWQGRGGPRTQYRSGWRYQRTEGRGKRNLEDFTDLSQLPAVADRLRMVQIECDDWRSSLTRYDSPETVFLLDPPYLESTRSDRWHRVSYTH
jgi:DNA adenine methylase